MTNIELLEQDAKDRGLIKVKTEHAYWGIAGDEQILKKQGYVPVKDKGKTIDCDEMRLYKIKRKKPIVPKTVKK